MLSFSGIAIIIITFVLTAITTILTDFVHFIIECLKRILFQKLIKSKVFKVFTSLVRKMFNSKRLKIVVKAFQRIRHRERRYPARRRREPDFYGQIIRH